MKALSLWQPWATLMAIGAKRFETRSWGTSYRGPLVICAARKQDDDSIGLAMTPPFLEALHAGRDRLPWLPKEGRVTLADYLPFGYALAVVNLVECWGVRADRMQVEHPAYVLRALPPRAEQRFGDYTPGRFAWETAGARVLRQPVPVRGRQQLFDLSPEEESAVRAALGGQLAEVA